MKNKLILIGPKTGIKGGATVSFNHLLNELNQRGISYTCIDMPGGNHLLKRFFWIIKYLLIFQKEIKKNSIISLHASDNSVLVYSLILDYFCRKRNSKLLIRVFGGFHLNYIAAKKPFLKSRILNCYRRNTLMLQTRGQMVEAQKKYNIENAVWFPTSRPAAASKSEESFNFTGRLELLYIGQLREEKGVDDLLFISEKILKQNLDIRIRLYGELFDDTFIKNLSENQEKVFQYQGVADPNEIYQIMRESDLLLFPSKFQREGYPGVIIEAINMNLPVISTGHHQYIHELLENGKNSILYSADHPGELWKIVFDLYQNQKKLLKFHRHLKQKEEKFTSEYWNGEYFLKLIERLRSEMEGKIV